MDPEWSKRFVQKLYQVAIVWLAIGTALTFSDPVGLSAFFQLYFLSALDLVFIMLIFWNLFFSKSPQRTKALRSIIFFTFKLVCLGLLAITLKRLRNAPAVALVLGLLFIGVGPLAAGMLSRIQNRNSKRESDDTIDDHTGL
jgi:hypothetical protein